MKKKFVSILAAALFTIGMASQAMAYFDNGNLIRIVYQTSGGTAEVATDLGNFSSFMAGTAPAAPSFIQGGTAGTAGALFGNTALSNLNVTYMVYDTNNPDANPATFSGGATAPNLVDGIQWGNATSGLQAYYGAVGTQQVVGSMGAANSYSNLFANGGVGLLGGMVDQSVEANLAALAGGGSVNMTIYAFADTVNGSALQTLGTITTNASGLTVSDATPTPIPPSFLLMGSGLLGMVGIRRKFTV